MVLSLNWMYDVFYSASKKITCTNCLRIKQIRGFSNFQEENLDDIFKIPKRVPGLVAVSFSEKIGVLCEINCKNQSTVETKGFNSLVENITKNCRKFFENSNKNTVLFDQHRLDKKELSKLPWLLHDKVTVQDVIALESKQLEDEISFLRATICNVSEFGYISGYAHPGGELTHYHANYQSGTHASIVGYAPLSHFNPKEDFPLREIGRSLCQHVVGSLPTTLGSPGDQPAKNGEDENRMLCQEYILDPDFTVSEIVQKYRVELLGFSYLELGEEN